MPRARHGIEAAVTELVQIEPGLSPAAGGGLPLPAATGGEKRPGESRRRRREFVRRGEDNSQTWRSAFQLVFLALNAWIGIQFFLWVLHWETGGRTVAVSRPPGVEGWLPIASLMNLKAWVLTGQLPDIHPAGVFLLVAFLGMSLVFRKSFCGWLCPIGTVSETLARAGQALLGRNLMLPRWADVALRSLKYVLLGSFLYAVGGMSVAAIRQFLDGPYGIFADVKMLNFFRHPSLTAMVVLGMLVVFSLLVRQFWCRYLCPYGALMGLASWVSPAAIRRVSANCIDCGKCSRVCPSRLPVDRLATVRSPECIGCYQCVAACPVTGALDMRLGRRLVLSPAWFGAGVAVIFLALVLVARFTGHWHTNLPDQVYRELVPVADRFSHP